MAQTGEHAPQSFTYDYNAMRERSLDPDVQDLYHSSPTNFPHPIDVDPGAKEQFGKDAVKSFETQAKVVGSVVAAPAGGTSVLGNAAMGGAIGALNSKSETSAGLVKDAAIGAAIGGGLAAIGPVVNQVKNWTGHGPSVVVGVGPRGAANLGQSANKLPPAQIMPGETAGVSFMKAPLTTEGRVLTGDATMLDKAVVKVKEAIGKATGNGRVDVFGNPTTASRELKVGELVGGKNGELFKNAYPNLAERGTVGAATKGEITQATGNPRATGFQGSSTAGGEPHPEIWVNEELRGTSKFKETISHELKHSIEPREPMIQSGELRPDLVQSKPGGTLGIKVNPNTASTEFQKEVITRGGAEFPATQIARGKNYFSNGGENGARIVGEMQRQGTTSVRDVLQSEGARTRAITADPTHVTGRRLTDSSIPMDQLDDKGGDINGRHGNFTNFLATDEVPETIFGIPVVQDESGYTEKDIEFFRENPKAAGFYEMGDEEVDEDVSQQATKGGKAAETFDTPIPEELKARYDAWYAQLPKNLQYTGDYDLQGAWLEKLGQPDKYEASQNGHLDDYGKKPNHITFSTGSKWHDPKVPERTGGEWRQAKDGSWDFYPGAGNKASDDELKAYFDKYEKGNRVHGRDAAKDVHGLVQKFKDHVRTYENRRIEPYRDVDGNWAVGYGSHYLADGTKVTPKTAATDRMIDDAFDADLARRVDLLAGHDRRQARYAIPGWRHMSPESRLMLLDVSWGRKDTLTEKKSPGLFRELRAAGRNTAALDDAVKRHYPSYRKATDANGVVDESKTAGLQNRRIALLKAMTGEDFSYDGKKWSAKENKFVEE